MNTRKDRQTLKWMDRRRDIIMCLKKKRQKNRQGQLVERGNMDRQTTHTKRERESWERTTPKPLQRRNRSRRGKGSGFKNSGFFEIFNDG